MSGEAKTIISAGGGGASASAAAGGGGANAAGSGGGGGGGGGGITSFITGISDPKLLEDASSALSDARRDGFDYVVTSLPDTVPLLLSSSSSGHGKNNPSSSSPPSSSEGGGRTDVTRLESKWWSTSVVGMISDPPRWRRRTSGNGGNGDNGNNNGDDRLVEALTCTSVSPAAAARRAEATEIFKGMMEWAAHMNIPAVIVPPVPLVENCDSSSSIGGDDEEDIFAEGDIDNSGHSHHKKRGRLGTAKSFAAASSSPRSSSPNNATISINNASAKEYARLVASLAASSVCSTSHVQLWVRVPLSLPSLRAFQLLLARCDHSSSVGCVLYVRDRIDASVLPELVRALHPFLGGGNIKAVSWDAKAFLKNKRGYPTLSKAHQFVFSLLYGRLGRTLRLLVEGGSSDGEDGGGGGSTGRLHHLQYLRHLRSRPPLASRLDNEEAALELPYLDSLQSPLQPLGDHLEYQTYETFERDPVKYKRYGEAVELALEDGIGEGRYRYSGTTRVSARRLERMMMMDNDLDDAYDAGFCDMDDDHYCRHGDGGDDMTGATEVDLYEVTIMVVGAGRGPLVREAVNAVSRESATWMRGTGGAGPTNSPSAGFGGGGGMIYGNDGRRKALRARVIAIEKNPSAVLYLRGLKASDPSWNGGRGGEHDEVGVGRSVNIIPGSSEVTVIGCDMRRADALASHPLLGKMMRNGGRDFGADIVVSELLGSFGDNELSPECLDGVQASGLLKEDCVSIPQSYTAFLAPVSSARLHSEAKAQSCLPLYANDGPASPSIGMQRALETPYVVRSHAASQTHAERPCWMFSHPHREGKSSNAAADAMMDTAMENGYSSGVGVQAAEDVDNDRHVHLSFGGDNPDRGAGHGCGYGPLDAGVATVAAGEAHHNADASVADAVAVHGFLGTFHSVLYESPGGKVKATAGGGNRSDADGGRRRSVISIAPGTFSVGMFSWFPLYFPLKEALRVPSGASLNCSMWRRSDEGRVWYEWCAEVAMASMGADGGVEDMILGTSPIHNPGGRSYHVKK